MFKNEPIQVMLAGHVMGNGRGRYITPGVEFTRPSVPCSIFHLPHPVWKGLYLPKLRLVCVRLYHSFL